MLGKVARGLKRPRDAVRSHAVDPVAPAAPSPLSAREPVTFGPQLLSLVEARAAQGCAAWPNLTIDAPGFAAHLRSLVDQTTSAPEQALSTVNVEDLGLAYACLTRVPGAAEAFEQRLRQTVHRYLKRIHGASDMNDEIAQVLLARFLIGTKERGPALADYRGRSTLAQFIGVCAQRLALNDRRDSRTRHRLLDRLANEMESGDVGIEQDLLRRKFRRPFEEALRAGLTGLPARQRLILRLHLVGGMSTRRLGRIFNVNASTVSRWVTDAREALWSAVRRDLQKSLALESRDLDSILRSVRSGLDISLSSVLVREDDADVKVRTPRPRG